MTDKDTDTGGTAHFLAVAPHPSPTRDLLAAAARWRGMEVVELSPRTGAEALRGTAGAHYYGGPRYADTVVDDLGVALLEPSETWLTSLPGELTGRRVRAATWEEARRLTYPAFVKPPTDKSFPAAVYPDGSHLPDTGNLPAHTPVQISEVVDWAAEFRLFLLDGEIRTGTRYATFGALDAAPLTGHPDQWPVQEFADRLLTTAGHTLPSAVVVDVGRLAGTGRWAVVEANMAWFSSCYAADPAAVLDVVRHATPPRSGVTARDRRFQRPQPHRGAAPD